MELQVEGKNLEIRKSWQQKIDDEKSRLARHHPDLLMNLRVTIEGTTHHKAGGYELRVVATVPNDTVVVKRKGESVKPLLGDAFDTLGLQLKELQRKKRQTVKIQEGARTNSSTGLIKTINPYESYGFIITHDGRDIYFHKNALKDMKLDQLSEGVAVRFGEYEGDKGPQANWVKIAK